MKTICFVSPAAYPVLANLEGFEAAGGGQTQLYLLGRELAQCGYDVVFLVGDYGQEEEEVIDGLRVIKTFDLFAGNKVTRFVDSYRSFGRQLRSVYPNVCISRGEPTYVGQIAYICSKIGVRYIYSSGNINNCDNTLLMKQTNLINRLLYSYGLRKANKIVVQTEEQRQMIFKSYGVESQVITNGRIKPEILFDEFCFDEFLWVGSFIPRKRPELFIELARRLPGYSFKLVGGSYIARNKAYYKRIVEMAKRVENLTHAGFIRDSLEKGFYKSAIALVNTSVASEEGFPNVFVEAWSYGKPVITLDFDPDGCIKENFLGFHSGQFDQLVADTKRLAEDSHLQKELQERTFNYFSREHDLEKIVNKWVALIEDVSKV